MIFPRLWSSLISFFCKLFETFCQHWMMYNMYNNNDNNNNVKSFMKRHFWGILVEHFLKINFYEKNCIYCIQQLWCTKKLDKFYAIYLGLTKEMAQKWHLWQELLSQPQKFKNLSLTWLDAGNSLRTLII